MWKWETQSMISDILRLSEFNGSLCGLFLIDCFNIRSYCLTRCEYTCFGFRYLNRVRLMCTTLNRTVLFCLCDVFSFISTGVDGRWSSPAWISSTTLERWSIVLLSYFITWYEEGRYLKYCVFWLDTQPYCRNLFSKLRWSTKVTPLSVLWT